MISEAQSALLCTPYQFQIESAKLLWECRYGISADEMGLGKSLEAILCAIAHMMEQPNAKIIFCVPAFLKANWDREISKFTLHINAKACHTTKQIPDDWRGIDALIINYEQLDKVKHLFRKATMVVADEAHMLKNHESKRTDLFYSYIKDFSPERVLLLSGTPIKNKVPEFFSLIRILDCNKYWAGKRLHPNFSRYTSFCNHFCYTEARPVQTRFGTKMVEQYKGFRNEKDFFELIKNRFVRHLAQDVLDLPTMSFHDVLTKKLPTPEEDVLGAELEELWNAHLAGIQSTALASRKKESAILKVPYTVQFVDQLLASSSDPVIVFTDHIASAELIADKYKTKAGLITGETSIPKRDQIVQRFQRNELDVLVATTGTMSAGWTLTAATSAVFNDKPWVPGDFLQAIKRFHRIGQTKKCFVYNIVTSKLDFMIMATLREKAEILSKAVVKTM